MADRRTALITGASAGLGEQFALQLAAQGFDLVLVARRRDRLEAAAAALREQFGISVRAIAAALSAPQSPSRIEAELQKEGIAIDVLINNAGAASPDLIDDRNWQDHSSYLELMMRSVAQMCHRFAPGMKERGYGRILNVASVAGRIPRSGDCSYGPSKAYLIALSEELALTLRPFGIHVTALCPGFTHTEFHEVGGRMAMKNALPKFIWYDADVVVREGLAALERGKSVYVSGRLYRMVDPLFQSVWTRRLFKISARPDAK